MHTYGHARPVL